MATAARFSVLGISDSRTTCDCCGKTNLKRTVALQQLADGSTVYYGTQCAADAMRMPSGRRYTAATAERLIADVAERDAQVARRLAEFERTKAKAQRHADRTGRPQTVYSFYRDQRRQHDTLDREEFDRRNVMGHDAVLDVFPGGQPCSAT